MGLNKSLSCSMMLALCSLSANAQGAPSITMHSENYELYGDGTLITLALGATEAGKIGVDCGDGIVVYDIVPSTFEPGNSEMSATYVPCTLTSTGNVAIYCYDGIKIDYFNADGCGLTTIDFADPEAVEILSLRHNSLESLDISDMCNVASVDLGDNPFGGSPLVVGGNKPNLLILSLDIIENLDQSFTLTDYPSLVSFSAYDNASLFVCDPSQCPDLLQLSIDDTPVSALDVSNNPELIILNVGGTDIRSLDVTNNTKLQQLYCSGMGRVDQSERLSHIDITNCPDLIYFFCSNNALTDIDVSQNPALTDLYLGNNLLTDIDLSNNTELLNVSLDKNYMSFATLPADQDWLYYYYPQHPIALPESYLVGTPIDLSDRVMREGTDTWAVVNIPNPDGPELYTQLDSEGFTFCDGVLTINRVINSEVFVEFYNSELTEYPMTTTWFKVKSAEEYGKNEFAFSVTYPETESTEVNLSIGMAGATEDNPRHFYVDLGDGEPIEGIATTSDIPVEPNFVYANNVTETVKVYVEADGTMSALSINGAIKDIDLTQAVSLQQLSLTDTKLEDINLSANSGLRSLVLTGNNFGDRFTLAGDNGAYNKNFLEYIDVSDNALTKFEIVVPELIKYLDVSDNRIGNINLTDAENLEVLDVSNNDLDYIRLSYQSSMKRFDGSHNHLKEIVMPETNVIEHFNLSYNDFTFATLPVPGEGTGTEYIYTDQADILIPAKGMSCNLSAEYVSVDGDVTAYKWVDGDGNTLITGEDYTITDGVTNFLKPAIGKCVHCMMSHPAFPELTLVTTTINLAGTPEFVIGEFTTPKGGQQAYLSLGGRYEGSTIFIDWAGDGNLSEYLLKPTYTLFDATTTAGARVKVYSYEQDNDLTIFSVSGITMSDVDLSGMTNLYCLSISSAGLSTIKMPEAPELHELFLVNNKFTEFDFSAFPMLSSLSFEKNLFTEVDLSALSNLNEINFASNKLTSITFGNQPELEAVHLSNNKLEEIDLSTVPRASQVLLNNNNLSHIDVNGLDMMRVFFIDHNRFDFLTLPQPREQWSLYVYGNQAPLTVEAIDGVVDLSEQSVVGDTQSSYYWLRGEPWIDSDTGELMGDMLIEGEDYVVDGGITTFYVDVPDAVGLILNDVFPRVYLTTEKIAVTATGITDAIVANPVIIVKDSGIEISYLPDMPVTIYGIDGRMVAYGKCDNQGKCTFSHLPKGMLTVTLGSRSTKIAVR